MTVKPFDLGTAEFVCCGGGEVDVDVSLEDDGDAKGIEDEGRVVNREDMLEVDIDADEGVDMMLFTPGSDDESIGLLKAGADDVTDEFTLTVDGGSCVILLEEEEGRGKVEVADGKGVSKEPDIWSRVKKAEYQVNEVPLLVFDWVEVNAM